MTQQMAEQIRLVNALAELAFTTLKLLKFKDSVLVDYTMRDFLNAIITAPNSPYRGCTFETFRDDPKFNIEIGFPGIKYTKTRGIELIK